VSAHAMRQVDKRFPEALVYVSGNNVFRGTSRGFARMNADQNSSKHIAEYGVELANLPVLRDSLAVLADRRSSA
jgi:hypothetical protein